MKNSTQFPFAITFDCDPAAFDQSLVARCDENGVAFGVNQETIRLGQQIFAERYGAAYEENSVRQRIKDLVRNSKKYAQD